MIYAFASLAETDLKENAVKRLLVVTLQALVLLFVPVVALAQQELVSDPEIYEKDHFRTECKVAEFGEGFITRLDINNDGLMDAITNRGALTCDGEKARSCGDDGCPYNFYVQVKEGGYLMIATATIYSYDFVQRFGNMVFEFKMHPRFCERTDSEPCLMTVRVRGTKFVTISSK
ncbi:hypothetical protein RMS29_000310 [Agrobacterium rosae]|uniref:Uncharacterized protein n=1 Tax=Agrobacterium rosae TaxID=1972867 RepID=A0AAE5S1J0_9HYPH|nr:hypothetical protein [Agrobacterium rosae]KAA3511035.1 hypothetical protein DXM21_16090 [Agrobacterium rosae]KAA3518073.1 hypothetical protein DXM25_16140 [Agrobacterium rosae]MQB49650.1 hypothetical protein [Agrobacterium rosae]POO54086.1 hypothetical protein CPJ18_00705 [Agrobacterium rosae]